MSSTGKYVFTHGLRELRFHMCQTSQHSAATRYAHVSRALKTARSDASDLFILKPKKQQARNLKAYDYKLTPTVPRAFLTRAYPTMKKNNPYIPILIREAEGVEPKVWARYEYGKEKMEPLVGLDDKGIEGKVTELVKTAHP